MHPKDLFARLLEEAKTNPTALSKELGGRPAQPQLHKFLHGEVIEPKRSTWEPVAAHFGVPVDAFFDPAVARRVAASRWGGGAKAEEPQPAFKPPPPRTLADLVSDLAQALTAIPEDQRRLAVDNLAALARDPSLRAARNALVVALTPDSLGESTTQPVMSRRKRAG